jgi:hypothetical protein
MAAWWWPTVRSISWVPLAGVSAFLGVLALWLNSWPEDLVGMAAGAVAAAVVAGLHDPAAALLSAMPTSAAVRRARRLALIVPVAFAVWIATADGPVVGLLVLAAAGVAVSVRAGVSLGAAVPLVWVIFAWAADINWELR